MRKITVFNSVSLDGYFTGEQGDLSWAHQPRDDKEWGEFVSGNAGGEGTLLFGRVTYEMMASYWPTPMAAQNYPEVAKGMNEKTKIVVSRTLKHAEWQNTSIADDLLATVRKLKYESGDDIVILGSGTIVSQLAQNSLIDTYEMVVMPIVLGKGRTMFEGLDKRVNMRLVESRTFRNGNAFHSYEPVVTTAEHR